MTIDNLANECVHLRFKISRLVHVYTINLSSDIFLNILNTCYPTPSLSIESKSTSGYFQTWNWHDYYEVYLKSIKWGLLWTTIKSKSTTHINLSIIISNIINYLNFEATSHVRIHNKYADNEVKLIETDN